MRKTWLWALAGMFVLAGISYAVFLLLAPPPLPEGFLYGNGQVEATEVTVSAEITGQVLESDLVEGRAVKAGDVLVWLDESDLQTRLKQDKAGADAAERNRAQATQQLATLRHHAKAAGGGRS
jgi:HlyD family secretion protein